MPPTASHRFIRMTIQRREAPFYQSTYYYIMNDVRLQLRLLRVDATDEGACHYPNSNGTEFAKRNANAHFKGSRSSGIKDLLTRPRVWVS